MRTAKPYRGWIMWHPHRWWLIGLDDPNDQPVDLSGPSGIPRMGFFNVLDQAAVRCRLRPNNIAYYVAHEGMDGRFLKTTGLPEGAASVILEGLRAQYAVVAGHAVEWRQREYRLWPN